jgi:multidrug efflux pump
MGHFPLVIATGPGAGARNSIGIMLVSGMIIGTLFTLFVVPSIYLLLARRRLAVVAPDDAVQDIIAGRVSPEGAAA